jgi:hypothetical protein
MKLDLFKPGDRVELVLHYSFWGEPPPQGMSTLRSLQNGPQR